MVNLALLSVEEVRSRVEKKSVSYDGNENSLGRDILNYNVYWETSDETVRLDYRLSGDAEVAVYLYDMQGPRI